MIEFLSKIGLFPPQASTMAARVDALYGFLLAVSAFFGVLIATLIVTFAFRYRRRVAHPYTPKMGSHPTGALALEITWTAIPFAIAMGIFVWSARIYFAMATPPADALEIHVVGKQWMWKLQHMEGKREINELHVPLGRPIKLTMTSEDVIHSFYVPAFRVKADVLPGRYSHVWFEPTREGTYHLFCAEYCGTEHSRMIGRIVVMSPTDYQRWLTEEAAGGTAAGGVPSKPRSLVDLGRELFGTAGCKTCHAVAPNQPDAPTTGPPLYGLYGSKVELQDGVVVADDEYLRRSLFEPMAQITKGYPPMMPTYQGRLSEEEAMRIIAYLKSLGAGEDHSQSTPHGGS